MITFGQAVDRPKRPSIVSGFAGPCDNPLPAAEVALVHGYWHAFALGERLTDPPMASLMSPSETQDAKAIANDIQKFATLTRDAASDRRTLLEAVLDGQHSLVGRIVARHAETPLKDGVPIRRLLKSAWHAVEGAADSLLDLTRHFNDLGAPQISVEAGRIYLGRLLAALEASDRCGADQIEEWRRDGASTAPYDTCTAARTLAALTDKATALVRDLRLEASHTGLLRDASLVRRWMTKVPSVQEIGAREIKQTAPSRGKNDERQR